MSLEVLVAMDSSSKNKIESEIHNSLGWVHAKDEKYPYAEKEFKEAIHLNDENKNAHENLKLLQRAKSVPRTAPAQIAIAILLTIPLIASYICIYKKLISDQVFLAQSSLLIVLILAVLFIQHIGYFKLAAVEFKMSEHGYAFAKTKASEMKRN